MPISLRSTLFPVFVMLSASLADGANNLADINDVAGNEDEVLLNSMDFAKAEQLERDGKTLPDIDHSALLSPDKFEGDILETPLSDGPADRNAVRRVNRVWPGGRVPFTISSRYGPQSRGVIAAAIAEFGRHTCVRFEPRRFTDRDYLYIAPSPGCYSMVGRKSGRQRLSIGSGCIHKGERLRVNMNKLREIILGFRVIMHELMHVVGFFHEQSRTDRDSYVKIVYHNIMPGMQGQFRKYSRRDIQYLETPYDYGSIMHYGPYDFSRNNQPTVVPFTYGVKIGQRQGFSFIDILKINRLYKCQSKSILKPDNPDPRSIFITKIVKAGAYKRPKDIILPRKIRPGTSGRGNKNSGSGFGGISGCSDQLPNCGALKEQGGCRVDWIWHRCRQTCERCSGGNTSGTATGTKTGCRDVALHCEAWNRLGLCFDNQSMDFMRLNCGKSCGYC